MNGSYLLDTNIVLGLLHEQTEITVLVPKLKNADLYCSVITRMELLSYHGLTQSAEMEIRGILNTFFILSLSPTIEEMTVVFRRMTRCKLPDAIIAASAMSIQAPLITCDKGLSELSYPGFVAYNPLVDTVR